MQQLLSRSNTKQSLKIATIATALLIVTYLVPDSAQAQRRRCPPRQPPIGRLCTSGTGNTDVSLNDLELDFTISDSFTSGANADELGVFKRAAEAFEVENRVLNKQLSFEFGNITASLLSARDLAQFHKTLDDLRNDNNNVISQPTFDYSNGGVKYEAAFSGSAARFTFFVPLPDSSPNTRKSFINSLFNLQTLSRIQGGISGVPNSFPQTFGLNSGSAEPLELQVSKIPEPMTGLLLGTGVSGAVLLLKRKQHSKKSS